MDENCIVPDNPFVHFICFESERNIENMPTKQNKKRAKYLLESRISMWLREAAKKISGLNGRAIKRGGGGENGRPLRKKGFFLEF